MYLMQERLALFVYNTYNMYAITSPNVYLFSTAMQVYIIKLVIAYTPCITPLYICQVLASASCTVKCMTSEFHTCSLVPSPPTQYVRVSLVPRPSRVRRLQYEIIRSEGLVHFIT